MSISVYSSSHQHPHATRHAHSSTTLTATTATTRSRSLAQHQSSHRHQHRTHSTPALTTHIHQPQTQRHQRTHQHQQETTTDETTANIVETLVPVTFSSPLPASIWSPSFDLSIYSASQLLDLSVALFIDSGCLEAEPVAGRENYVVPVESLRSFLDAVRSSHHPQNTYHSWIHGVHVLYNIIRFIAPIRQHFTNIELFTLYLAGICHDLAHCGMGNAWCIDNKYWCNPDHQSKEYIKNLLERNSLDRTTEILTGEPVSRPAFPCATSCSSSSTHVASAAPTTPSTSSPPRNYLAEWSFSSDLRTQFLSSLNEYILGTDLSDKERHLRMTAEFREIVNLCTMMNANTANNRAATVSYEEEKIESECDNEDDEQQHDEDADICHGNHAHEYMSDVDAEDESKVDPAILVTKKRVSSQANCSPTNAKMNRQVKPKKAKVENVNKLSIVISPAAATSPTAAPVADPSTISFVLSTPIHRTVLTRVLLLCADIGCVSEVFPIAMTWADRLYEESFLGQNFLVAQAQATHEHQIAASTAKSSASTNKKKNGTIATAAPMQELWCQKALEMRQESLNSRYIIEGQMDTPSPTHNGSTFVIAPAANSTTSSSSSYIPYSSGTPCASLSTFYKNQLCFFSAYAIPLFTPLHNTGLLSSISQRFYPQLVKNLNYLREIDFLKSCSSLHDSKMKAEVREWNLCTSLIPTRKEHTKLIKQLQAEYSLINAFHTSVNTQNRGLANKEGKKAPPMIQLQELHMTPYVFPITNTTIPFAPYTQPQQHALHQFGGCCRSIPPPPQSIPPISCSTPRA